MSLEQTECGFRLEKVPKLTSLLCGLHCNSKALFVCFALFFVDVTPFVLHTSLKGSASVFSRLKGIILYVKSSI